MRLDARRALVKVSVIAEIDGAVFTLSDDASHFRFPPSVGIPGTGSLKLGDFGSGSDLSPAAVELAAVLTAVKLDCGRDGRMASLRSNKRMASKQSTCQHFVIMISKGDHHDLCSKILAHRINLLGQ
jgi:hypothetical protein